MPYSSLGDFIKAAAAIGEVQYVKGADLELDVGCLTESVIALQVRAATDP